MGLNAALAALEAAVTGAINGATPPIAGRGQVVIGWPSGPDLVSILGQNDDEWQVSIWPLPGAKDASRYAIVPDVPIKAPPPTLSATISGGNVVTFSGTPQATANVHSFVLPLAAPALYTVAANDTLNSIATHVAAAINALGYSGVSAVATGASVTVSGSRAMRVNVSSPQIITVINEVGRTEQSIQVTTWAPDPNVRNAIHDAIIANVGTKDRLFLTMSDNTALYCEYETESWDDTSQSSYSLYQSRVVFLCEYGISRSITATQVGAGIAAVTVGNAPQTTAYTPGN